jgi:hypothetical protein
VAWTSLAVNCPPLTAAGFESFKPVDTPVQEDSTLLAMECHYGEATDERNVIASVIIQRDPAKYGLPAEVIASDLADKKKRKDVAVVELAGFPTTATATASVYRTVQIDGYSKNASLFAVVKWESPVDTEAQIRERSEVLSTILRDLSGNLR